MISPARTEVNAMPATPESQDGILAAALAALTAADIPPDDDAWAITDTDTGRPAELAGLTTADLDELAAAAPAPPAGVPPAGWWPRDGSGGGIGFADGGPLDVLAAGITLAEFTDDAHARAGDLDDDSLIGVLRAWDRLTSWAQARKLNLIAELARRRPADRTPPAPPGEFPVKLSEFLPDEIAMALTLTQRGAENQVGLALDLAARPRIAAALEAGRIDLYKARILLEALTPLAAEHAAAVEAAILPAAGGLTAGELRAEVTQAVLALDPDAMRKRRQEAEKTARVECWTDPEGTATLAGRNLPPAEVLAADKRLCQVAAFWKKQIRAAWKQADPNEELPRPEHGMDLLRAWAYLALLLGQPLDTPPAGFLPPADLPRPVDPVDPDSPAGSASPGGGRTGCDRSNPDSHGPSSGNASPADSGRGTGPATPDGGTCPDSAGPVGQPVPAGLRRPGLVPGPYRGDPVAGLPPLAGTINVTLPLATLLGLSDRPGVAAGYGPLPGDVVRDLANAAAGHPAASWGLIIIDPHGQAVGYGYAPRAKPIRGHPADGWTITLTTQRIAGGHSP
jgi:hypothetical protein